MSEHIAFGAPLPITDELVTEVMAAMMASSPLTTLMKQWPVRADAVPFYANKVLRPSKSAAQEQEWTLHKSFIYLVLQHEPDEENMDVRYFHEAILQLWDNIDQELTRLWYDGHPCMSTLPLPKQPLTIKAERGTIIPGEYSFVMSRSVQ